MTTPLPAGSQPAVIESAHPVTMPRGALSAALEEARERGFEHGRKATKAEMRAALAAQTEAHEAELTRVREAGEAAMALALQRDHEKAVHRVRSTRWFNLLVGFSVGTIISGIVMFAIARGTLTAGADMGIEAATKTRIIEDSLERARDPQPAPDYGPPGP